jgi:hypothetical protein
MDKRILKYKLVLTDTQNLVLPAGSQILSVKVQGNDLVLYALVSDFVARQDTVEISIIGTGSPIPQEVVVYSRFLDTVMQGQFVWHIFYKVVSTI